MKIDITLDDNRGIVSNSKNIGKENENKATILVFHITDRISKLNFYLDLEMPDGSKFRTAKLTSSNNIIEYKITNTILSKRGFLRLEVILQDENNYVEKYPQLVFKINDAINAIENIPEENPTLSVEIQKVIDLVSVTGDGTKYLSDDGTYKEVSGGSGGTTNYDDLENKPITRLVSMEAENPIVLRNLDSGIYCLHGYILPFDGSTALFVAQTPISVNVAKSSEISFVQLFFSFGNQLQYFEVTDDNYTMKNVSFNDLAAKDYVDGKIPTKISQLENDSGFITSIPTEYVTETEMNTAIESAISGALGGSY